MSIRQCGSDVLRSPIFGWALGGCSSGPMYRWVKCSLKRRGLLDSRSGHTSDNQINSPMRGSVVTLPGVEDRCDVSPIVKALVGALRGAGVRACCEMADRGRCCFEIVRIDHAG